MLKHIYRLVICLIIFGVFVAIFSKNIREEKFTQEIETVNRADATFPVMSAGCKGYSISTLHGYITTLKPTVIRDGIIPMDEEQTIELIVKKNETKITKGSVSVIDIQSGETIEECNINSFTEKDGNLIAKVKLSKNYENGEEYSGVFTLVTDKGDKIKYYSRIKKLNLANFSKIMDYAMGFHNDVLDKDTASKVVNHIEPDSSMENKDLAYVNIHSSLDLISYGDLGPDVITDIRPTVREVSEDTAVIELEFYVQAKTGSGKETYKVNESFRIRWTATRMYLLFYDRTMESVFDVNLVSVSKNEFKLGITQGTDANYIATKDSGKMAFVRNGELWYYNTALNEMSQVFSFRQDKTDYIRDTYDNHDIKILSMDDFGNMDFMVYGYMNSGEYEGRVGIVLYKYYSAEARIEEQVYIPVDVPFNVLKGYVSDFAYVNSHNVFYFSLGESIYSYDMITDKLDTIAQNVKEDKMVMPENGGFMAWMDSDDLDAKIKVMNLETGEQSTFKSKEGKCIRLLGGIGTNVIYGYANSGDVANSADGTVLVPMYVIEIANMDGEIVKKYTPSNGYVSGAQVIGNKIKFSLVKKDSNGYFVPVDDDYIFNSDMVDTEIKTSYRLTDKTMTEWYLQIPKSVNIPKAPDISETLITKLDDEKIVRVDLDAQDQTYYYVFAYHGLEKKYDNAGEAIVLSDERMGSVFDSDGYKIWERGNMADTASVKATEINKGSSIEACMRMLIASSHSKLPKGAKFDTKNKSITDVLEEYMDAKPVNMTGAKLSEVLYYVSEGKPVMAMLSSTKAVLITGYTGSTVSYIDLSNGVVKKSIKEAEKDFAKVGNVFISYVQ